LPFASAVAVTLVMIAAQDPAISGEFGVQPDVLLQAFPARRWSGARRMVVSSVHLLRRGGCWR
jgi:hypothetical protein